ncbi:hypothetical protein HOY80DRAFT_1004790 [Tuber brumale]|nr:hypothetical protein HOY80DRAFT_1004790 [Tuber brumale]
MAPHLERAGVMDEIVTPMTPNELATILLRDEYQVLDIHPESFVELEYYIRGRAYTYRPALRQLKIKMATQIHASIADWAAGIKIEGEARGAFDSRDLRLVPEGRLTGFIGQYQGITKVPDCAIIPRGRPWPTIVFEFGYTEPYDDLKADVKLLLEGSRGNITKAILIKLDPLYAAPESHATQKLDFSLGDLFRNRLDDLTNEGWGKKDTLSLRLDDLRTSIEEGTWCHLVQKDCPEVDIPANKVFFTGKPPVLRSLFVEGPRSVGAVGDLIPLTTPREKARLIFKDVKLQTLLILLYYIYTDSLVGIWNQSNIHNSGMQHYRAIQFELSSISSKISLDHLAKALEAASYPSCSMNRDFSNALSGPSRSEFKESADTIIELASGELYGSSGQWLLERGEQGIVKVDMRHISKPVMDIVIYCFYSDWGVEGFHGVKAEKQSGKVEEFIDLVLEVMSVANELMLGRLCQVYQNIIGHYAIINTRNAAYMLMALAGCSENGFKDMCMQYICLNMETTPENHLLDELDADLMVDLDWAVRSVQQQLFPHSRTSVQEMVLGDIYPNMLEAAAKEKKALIASYSLEESDTVPLSTSLKNRRVGSYTETLTPFGSPQVQKAKGKRARSLLYPTSGVPGTSSGWGGVKGKGIDTPSPNPGPQFLASDSPRSRELPTSTKTPTTPSKPWGAPPALLEDKKLDIKEIMKRQVALAAALSPELAIPAQIQKPSACSAKPAWVAANTGAGTNTGNRRWWRLDYELGGFDTNSAGTAVLSAIATAQTTRSPSLVPTSRPLPKTATSTVPSRPATPRRTVSVGSVELTLKPSLVDIISQEEAYKGILREHGVKRSLQEIQEEQEFMRW